jgi:hypothetical protein
MFGGGNREVLEFPSTAVIGNLDSLTDIAILSENHVAFVLAADGPEAVP